MRIVVRALALAALAACGGVQSAPGRKTLASGQSGEALAMSQDADNLYFVELDGTNERLLSVPKTGGPLEQVTTNTSPIGVIAADDAGLYWIAYDGSTGGGQLWTRGTAGAQMLSAAVGGGSTGLPSRAGLDAQALYYTDNAGNVWRVARDGSASTMIGTSDLGPAAVALDGSDVWVATKHGAKRLPSTELSLTVTPPLGIAAADGAVYVWTNPDGNDGSVIRGSLGAASVTVASNLVSPGDVAPAGANVYIATTFGIHIAAADGGADSSLGGSTDATTVACDADAVYWSDGRAVYSVPR